MRIVLANASLANYPQGGGHWTFFLQYVFGLRDLGHDVFWLEVLPSTGDHGRDRRFIDHFFARFRRYGFADRCSLLLHEKGAPAPDLSSSRVHGVSAGRLEQIARSADLVWNFACSLRQPLLGLFKRRVLVDGDPGHLQVSALSWDMGIHDHDVFLTSGTKLREPDCEVPTLGLRWQPFVQFVYLPMWEPGPVPPVEAPITSVTHWKWEELYFGGRVLSVSKRDAYLRYLDVPRRTGQPLELAVNLHPDDVTGDRELLLEHGWRLVHPYQVASSPAAYRRYIKRSRAEFSCPKPIHRVLRTGWFSDRSACYLAMGRPVLMEDNGFGDHLPTGEGLLAFRDADEVAAHLEDLAANYQRHRTAARDIAESRLGSRRCLEAMLAACA